MVACEQKMKQNQQKQIHVLLNTGRWPEQENYGDHPKDKISLTNKKFPNITIMSGLETCKQIKRNSMPFTQINDVSTKKLAKDKS